MYHPPPHHHHYHHQQQQAPQHMHHHHHHPHLLLEHVLLPQVHDAALHVAALRDAQGHTFCLECAVECLQGPPQQLLPLRRKRLLVGMATALEHLPRHEYQYSAQRVLAPLVACMLEPDAHQPVPDLADSFIGTTKAFVAAALVAEGPGQQQLQEAGEAEAEVVAFVAAVVYAPLLGAIRAQGVAQAAHLVRLLSALLEEDDGLHHHLATLLQQHAPPIPVGSSINSGGGSGGSSSQENAAAAASIAAALPPFLEFVAMELAAPLPVHGGGGGHDDHSQGGAAAAAAFLRNELLFVLLRLCQAGGGPTRLWVLQRRLLPRALGQPFFQAMARLTAHEAAGPAASVLSRNLLALALLFLPSAPQRHQQDDERDRLYEEQEEEEEEGHGQGGSVTVPMTEAEEELLQWQVLFCSSIVKPLLIGGTNVAEASAAYVLRLLEAAPGVAEELIDDGLVEHLVEGLRVLLRPPQQASGGHVEPPRLHRHAAALVLRALSQAAPLGFHSMNHFPPVLFQEVLGLAGRALALDAASTQGHAASFTGGYSYSYSHGGGQEDQEDEEEGSAAMALLAVVEGALQHATVLYSEETMDALLRLLGDAAAVLRQQQQQQQQQLHLPPLGTLSALCGRLLLLAGRYVSAEVVNNTLLFPSGARLEALTAGLQELLLHATPALATATRSSPSLLLGAAFAVLQVAELAAARGGGGGGGGGSQSQSQDTMGGSGPSGSWPSGASFSSSNQPPPLVAALAHIGMRLASLAAGAAEPTAGRARTEGEDVACCLCFRSLLALLQQFAPSSWADALVAGLLDAGLLEAALSHLGGVRDHEAEGAFVELALALLERGTGVGFGGGGGGGGGGEAPALLLDLAGSLAKERQRMEADGAAAAASSAVQQSIVSTVRALAADPRQLPRWIGVDEEDENGDAAGISKLDLLLAVWLCLGQRRLHATCPDAPVAVRELLDMWGSLPTTSSSGGSGKSSAGTAIPGITPTTIHLLYQIVQQHGAAATSDPDVASGLEAVFGALTPAQRVVYVRQFVGRPEDVALLLRLGGAAGPQACFRQWMSGGSEQQRQQHFSAALHLLTRQHEQQQHAPAVLALLHSCCLEAGDGRSMLLHRGLAALHEASLVLGPGLRAADVERTRAVLRHLHDLVLPALAAASSAGAAEGPAPEEKEEEEEEQQQQQQQQQQDEQEEAQKTAAAAAAVVLVARIACAAATTWPSSLPSSEFPPLSISTRLLLLVAPPSDGRPPPQLASNAQVVAAALALVNQLRFLGRLPPDAAHSTLVQELSWARHEDSPAMLAHALLHALLTTPASPAAPAAASSGPPGQPHPLHDLGFLARCLDAGAAVSLVNDNGSSSPSVLLAVRHAALALACRLLALDDHRTAASSGSSKQHRQLRLAAQGCLLEPPLRSSAAALLLRLPMASATAAITTNNEWDAFGLSLLLLPSSPPPWPAHQTLYLAACLGHGSAAARSAALTQLLAPQEEEASRESTAMDHLIHWVAESCSRLATGAVETLPARFPVVLHLLRVTLEAGAVAEQEEGVGGNEAQHQKRRDAVRALRESLRELFCGRSSTLVPDDPRMVEEVEKEEGADAADEEQVHEGLIWWPKGLDRWAWEKGMGSRSSKHDVKEGEEAGRRSLPISCPREIDLRAEVARLRALAEKA